MTEYTISPQAYREFMSARDRTAYWVQHYDPEEVYSPSTVPEGHDGFIPPSPAMSTASLPPKMVLRYNDGRGDIPIPHPVGAPNSRSSQHRSHNGHHRSQTTSHVSSPLAGTPPPTPEEIHILPSRSSHIPSHIPSNTASSSSYSSHNRSRSMPRNRHPVQDVPLIAPPVPRSRPSQHNPQAPYSPWTTGRSGLNSKPAPPIVYAPGRHHGPNYEPPLMLHHPPQMGPNGMIYSHSAPPVVGAGPSQYSSPHSPAYPNVTRTDDERTGRPMDREYRRSSRGRQPIRRKGSSDTLNSQDSGGTYYVLPASGQKVHVIAASPERSIETASSTTKNGGSPYSQTSVKKPFFGRLFARFASPAPSKREPPPSNRKLHRRHSIGAKMGEHR